MVKRGKRLRLNTEGDFAHGIALSLGGDSTNIIEATQAAAAVPNRRISTTGQINVPEPTGTEVTIDARGITQTRSEVPTGNLRRYAAYPPNYPRGRAVGGDLM